MGACCSQEEVGTRGSQVTCRTIEPDIAIVFEGCPADDTGVFAERYKVQTAIKKGPMLRQRAISESQIPDIRGILWNWRKNSIFRYRKQSVLAGVQMERISIYQVKAYRP